MALAPLILAIVLAANAQVRVTLLVSMLIFMIAASVVARSNSLNSMKR